MSERPELEFWVLEEQYQALGELRGEPLSGTEETRSPVLLFRLPISCESRKDRPARHYSRFDESSPEKNARIREMENFVTS